MGPSGLNCALQIAMDVTGMAGIGGMKLAHPGDGRGEQNPLASAFKITRLVASYHIRCGTLWCATQRDDFVVFSLSKGRRVAIFRNPQGREMSADRVGDVPTG